MSPATTRQHRDECQPPRRRVRAFLRSQKLDAMREIFSDSAFLSCFPVHMSKHPLKPDAFTLDAKLHVILIVGMFIFMTPPGKAFVSNSVNFTEFCKLVNLWRLFLYRYCNAKQ